MSALLKPPALLVEIVESTTVGGGLSIRLGGSIRAVKDALATAGFKAGDKALITLEQKGAK